MKTWELRLKGADLKDGLLAIELVREIPEAMKPRKIAGGAQPQKERSAIAGDGQPASNQTVDAEAEHA